MTVWATLEVNVYMDDIVIGMQGSRQEVRALLAEAAVDVAAMVKAPLTGFAAGIVEDKMAIIASDAKLANDLRRDLAGLVGHAQASAEAAVNLGIDFMPGAKRSTFKRAKLQSRLWNGAKRTQRILKVQAMMTRGKARMSRICMAGLKPQLGFGARVNGLNMDERKAVRAMVAKPMQPTTGGANYLAKLILYNPCG